MCHGSPRAGARACTRHRAAALVLAAIPLLAVVALAAQELSVQVREGVLRERPSYLAAGTVPVAYGLRLTVVGEQGPWRRVTTPDGREGWLHVSALTEKKLQLASGDTDARVGADGDEIALAGKGFNAEVERSFQDANQDVDYTWVDRMAAWRVSPADAAAFLAAGEVRPRAGGAR